MLWQVGPLSISRRPFHIEEWTRDASASWAKKDLLGRRPDREFTGEGEETLTLKGKLHPFNRRAIAGLSSIELAHSLRRSGQSVFVTRGDGTVYGFYAIENVQERHSAIGPHTGGVGQEIEHELKLVPVGQPGTLQATDMLSALISLFG
ncbi:MAG: phage tail protein [Methylobacterium sp.]|uniref:phage tail protein n=1 Tax=Methylobacterium sp. TaxID=409 RepID=UPI0027185EFA|nr:phage tail protein [Methylobacterium sp.]MDO9428459.1 phage tail protein [Methylobacterium sp.]